MLQSGFYFVLGRFCTVFVAQNKFLSYMSQVLQISKKKDQCNRNLLIKAI